MRKKLHEQTPRIGPRDVKILEEIWSYGFRTYDELHSRFLKNYSKSWGYRILKRLTLLGYVDEYSDPKGNLIGWKSGRTNCLPDYLKSAKNLIPTAKSPKYFSNFEHDLALRLVLDEFKKLPITSEVSTEHELRRKALSSMKGYSKRDLNEISSKIPDGRFKLKLGQKEFIVALEIELTQKTDERIQSKLEHYIAKSSYDFVLYTCGNQATLNAVLRNYQHVLAHSPKVKFSSKRNPIYFCSLLECKENLVDAKIFSTHDSFKLSQFLASQV